MTVPLAPPSAPRPALTTRHLAITSCRAAPIGPRVPSRSGARPTTAPVGPPARSLRLGKARYLQQQQRVGAPHGVVSCRVVSGPSETAAVPARRRGPVRSRRRRRARRRTRAYTNTPMDGGCRTKSRCNVFWSRPPVAKPWTLSGYHGTVAPSLAALGCAADGSRPAHGAAAGLGWA